MLTRDHLVVVVALSDLGHACVNPPALPERASWDGIWTPVRGAALASGSASVRRLHRCLETSRKHCNLAFWCFDALFSEGEETIIYLPTISSLGLD